MTRQPLNDDIFYSLRSEKDSVANLEWRDNKEAENSTYIPLSRLLADIRGTDVKTLSTYFNHARKGGWKHLARNPKKLFSDIANLYNSAFESYDWPLRVITTFKPTNVETTPKVDNAAIVNKLADIRYKVAKIITTLEDRSATNDESVYEDYMEYLNILTLHVKHVKSWLGQTMAVLDEERPYDTANTPENIPIEKHSTTDTHSWAGANSLFFINALRVEFDELKIVIEEVQKTSDLYTLQQAMTELITAKHIAGYQLGEFRRKSKETMLEEVKKEETEPKTKKTLWQKIFG